MFLLTSVTIGVDLHSFFEYLAGLHIGELLSVGLEEGRAREEDLGVDDVELHGDVLDVGRVNLQYSLVGL